MTTTSKRWLGAMLGATFAVAAPHVARANEHDRAEELFQRARDLMGQNDFATACPMLEEAYSLDQGGGTLLALALCDEGAGKSASALRKYREALAQAVAANRPDRVMLAESHVQALESTVPRIAVHLAQPEPAGVAISLDRAPLDRALFAAGAPVDPGTFALGATAPGMVTWRTTVEVTAASHTVVVEVPPFRPVVVPSAHLIVAELRETKPRMLGIIASSLGGVGVGVGAYYGISAFRAENRSKQDCLGNVCSPAGVQLNHDARRDALISNIAFGAGGAALVTGIVFLVRSLEPNTGAYLHASAENSTAGFVTSW